MVTLNFSNVPSREAIPEGIYNLQIAKAEEVLSSNNNPMLKIEFDVLGVDGNRKLWENYPFVDAALWKIRELFNALGMDTSDIVEIDVMDLVGQCVQAKVIREEYQGEPVNRVKKILPAA